LRPRPERRYLPVAIVSAPSDSDRSLDNSSDKWSDRWGPLALLAGGAALLLPRLSAYGLWDPTEVRVADAARNVMESHAPAGSHVAFGTDLVALGFAKIGIGEVGGRLPLALTTLVTILVVYWAGRAILRPRAALLSAVAFATMPAVLFGGRQLTSAAPLTLGVALAVGGLVHALWPREGSGPIGRALAVGAALGGLLLGHAAGGLIMGVVTPLVAVAAALLATRVAVGRALGLLGLVVALGVAVVLEGLKVGTYSKLLGGMPRIPQHQTVVTGVLRSLGFASTPWLALAPFALLRALSGGLAQKDGEEEPAHVAFRGTLLTGWLAATYFLATLHSAVIADALIPAAPALALLVGAYLDELLRTAAQANLQRAIEGITVAVLAVVLGHDVLLTTEAFVSVQSLEQLRWPVQLNWTGPVLFGFMALFGSLLATALVLPLGWPVRNAETRRMIQRGLILASVGTQVVFAFQLVQWFIPAASKHLSPKELYGKTRQLDPNAPLGQYHFNATGASYYMNGRSATQLNSLDEVMTFLKKPERVFIFIGAEELASVDQASRGGTKPETPDEPDPVKTVIQYYVIDDSNSRFLILSNQLGPQEKDLNPLRRFVSDAPTVPKTKLLVNFEDKLQLIGYDLPDEASRGEDVKVRLHFHVLAPVGGSYKVFLHFDGPGARINGDHVPLDGKFPTQFWTKDTYVIDEYMLKPDRATQPAGVFQLYFGLFAGDRRMKVKEGPSDGENRVKLGSVRVH
jgi:4-amino-4-deoxy-L-arabinose transferase-like glycosyltransferase